MKNRILKKQFFLFLAVFIIIFENILICCSKNSSQLQDFSSMKKINVISREEGSGTRSEFENLINTNSQGTSNIAIETAQE